MQHIARQQGDERHEAHRSLEEVRRLVALGEGSHVEFKLRVPEGSRVVKEIAAFANSGGGRLLVGVGDEGDIVGVRDADEEEYSLQEALRVHADPPIPCVVRRIPVTRRREVLLVEVPASDSRPHYVSEDGESDRRTVYIRVEDMSVEASREAVRLMRNGDGARDVRFEFGEKEAKLMRYLEAYGRITVEQFARLANLPRSRASQTLVILTRARLLRIHWSAQGDYFTARREVAA